MTPKVYERKPEGFTPRVTIGGCYCTCADKILLLKRSPQNFSGETWCLPGGKREAGESRLEGAKRELYEECGIELLHKDLQHLVTLYLEFPDYIPKQIQDLDFCQSQRCSFDFLEAGYKYDFSIYHCLFKKKPTLHLDLREHTEAEWVTYEEALCLPLIHGGAQILESCAKIISRKKLGAL